MVAHACCHITLKNGQDFSRTEDLTAEMISSAHNTLTWIFSLLRFLSLLQHVQLGRDPLIYGKDSSFIFLSLSLSLSVTFSLLSHHTLSISALVQSQKILTWVSIESDRPQKRAFSFNVTLHSQLSWRSRGTCHRCCRLTPIEFAFCFEIC